MRGAATAAAVDLGSSSGRVVLGRYDGAAVTLEEVHRFPHEAQTVAGSLCWDVDRILVEVHAGVSRARAAAGGTLDAAGVDGWGVDHVLVRADGTRLGPVYAYRDDRTRDVPELLGHRAPAELLWELTGVRPSPINTSHQLVATLRDHPGLREELSAVLLLPDYVTFRLSGERGWSRAICSTSGLCSPGAERWSEEVLDLLGLDRGWFGTLSPERTVAGTLTDHPGTALVRGGSHDTACAVHALPPTGRSRVFLSSGSWSIIGVELDRPLLDGGVRDAGLTNEARTDGGVRLLRNLTGLWILQECQRQWAREGRPAGVTALVEEARAAEPLGVLLDPDDPVFALPGAMADRVAEYLRRRHRLPENRGQLVRTVLESLAGAYARWVAELTRLTPVTPDHLVIVGGGARNSFLVELTAAACDMPVVVGPPEASALGSVLAQLQALGHLGDDLGPVLEASFPRTVVEPGRDDPSLRRLADLSHP